MNVTVVHTEYDNVGQCSLVTELDTTAFNGLKKVIKDQARGAP